MTEAFNLLPGFILPTYAVDYLRVIGILLFAYIIFQLCTLPKTRINSLIILNLCLILIAISCLGLANIFGENLYPHLIKFLPFITNGSFWAYYIFVVPFMILIGLLFEKRKKQLYFFAGIFIFFTILPLINVDRFEFKKVSLTDLPKPYQTLYFSKPKINEEPTDYIIGTCWRAEYMNDLEIPTHCINMQENYPSISFKNPRHLSGGDYYISEKLYANTNTDNLRITHNLKNIVAPNDMVVKKGQGPETGKKEILLTSNTKKKLDTNPLLDVEKNENFNFYFYKNKYDYDFFIYSPLSVVNKNTIDSITDNSLNILNRPVVLTEKNNFNARQQNVKVFYKNPLNLPTTYYLKLTMSDTELPLILQMNQTFNESWKLKLIDKSDFENIQCQTEIIQNKITNNESCRYKDSLLPLENIRLLTQEKLIPANHIRGNYLGNTWIINPSQLNDNRNNNDLFIAIIYQNTYTIFIALSSILLLLLLTVAQEAVHLKKTHKKTV
jgi:hypothetical protein